jgi:hypothetical protein
MKNFVEKTPSGVLTTNTLSGSGVLEGQINRRQQQKIRNSDSEKVPNLMNKRNQKRELDFIQNKGFTDLILPIFYYILRSTAK